MARRVIRGRKQTQKRTYNKTRKNSPEFKLTGRSMSVSSTPMRGKSNSERDKKRQAMPPGKRISASGRLRRVSV